MRGSIKKCLAQQVGGGGALTFLRLRGGGGSGFSNYLFRSS